MEIWESLVHLSWDRCPRRSHRLRGRRRVSSGRDANRTIKRMIGGKAEERERRQAAQAEW